MVDARGAEVEGRRLEVSAEDYMTTGPQHYGTIRDKNREVFKKELPPV